MRQARVCSVVAAVLATLPLAWAHSAEDVPVRGLRNADLRVHAITGARVVAAPGRMPESATIIIRNGVIEAVDANVAIPTGARVWPASGLTIYPGLIDTAVLADLPGLPDGPGRHWSRHVHPELRAAAQGAIDSGLRQELRTLGFTVAAVYPASGVLRGSGAVVALAEEGEHVSVYRDRAALAIGLDPPGDSSGDYPVSLMGVIALIRQTFYDAQWHAASRRVYERFPQGHEPPPPREALAALDDALARRQAVLFDGADELNALRAAKIAREFNLDASLLGSGLEFRRLDDIATLDMPIIVPLAFPEAPDVSTIHRAHRVTLRELMTWEQAPTNARRLADVGVPIALTSHRLQDRAEFPEVLRSAIRHGLSEEDALAALTVTPARLLGLDHVMGTVEPGKVANLVVVDGSLFDEGSEIREVWVNGRRSEISPAPTEAIVASGVLRTDLGHVLPITIDAAAPAVAFFGPEEAPLDAEAVRIGNDRIAITVDGRAFGQEGFVQLAGVVTDQAVIGAGTLPGGERFHFTIAPAGADEGLPASEQASEEDGSSEAEAAGFEMPPENLVHPLGAYGLSEPPASPPMLIQNATIWTGGEDGILPDTDMMVDEGKIVMLGRDLNPVLSNMIVIDAAGKHITPGLIDSHSHTGISGEINEFAQANTAEVRVGDCVDSDDINFYRQLAGGLTAAHLLHGSGNPIGGQNAIVKLKWGGAPDEMLISDAIGSIKFALGENVKGDRNRYPNTRMGVETYLRDAFAAAREYEEEWNRYLALPEERQGRMMPPRRDLELDALVEVLHGRRLVHCHAYRQDEILMLMRLAEEYGFTIGTFEHALEGYKVADAMAAHGAGAGGFADWWGYKVEAMDAIPYNGSLMTELGVTVSFNSDSSELSRRLNTEAAKAVRYGGMEVHEALGLVTRNPARQLRLEHRMGSLAPGNDADFVVWSDDPLSAYARCEQTWIEGARYFDLQTDQRLREEARAERHRIIQKILTHEHGSATGAVEGEEGADRSE